jgi:hypothetical protein
VGIYIRNQRSVDQATDDACEAAPSTTIPPTQAPNVDTSQAIEQVSSCNVSNTIPPVSVDLA